MVPTLRRRRKSAARSELTRKLRDYRPGRRRNLQSGGQYGRHGFHRGQQGALYVVRTINTHLLQSALKHNCKKFFYSSSACVYNADKQKTFEAPSLKEADAYPAQPEDGYGWEKLFSERMCRHFR